MMKRILSLMLIACICFLSPGMSVLADAYNTEDMPYLALGADLTSSQKSTVLKLLGVKEDELDNYNVVTVTNKEEHEYLGDYLSQKVIGTKALSSVLVTKTKEKSGITVETQNINFCTDLMYCNALVTAGIEDADVVVAGPFGLTGTAALVGTIKAYAAMTGTEVSAESVDAATDELVLTGELGEELGEELGDTEEGKETAGELMALVKQKVVEDGLSTQSEIVEAVEQVCGELDVSISEESQEKIARTMGKISKLDLNLNTLKTQAKDLYDKLAAMDIDTEGFWSKVGDFFKTIGEKVGEFFSGLFSS